MSSVGKNSFIPCFPIWIVFLFLSCLIAVVWNSSKTLTRSDERTCLFCLWAQRENVQFLTIKCDVSCSFLRHSLSNWGSSPLMLVFWDLLSWKGVQFCHIFSCVEWYSCIIVGLESVDRKISIDQFLNVKSISHNWNKSQFVVICRFFSYTVGYYLLMFCWRFLHLYSWEILVCSFSCS